MRQRSFQLVLILMLLTVLLWVGTQIVLGSSNLTIQADTLELTASAIVKQETTQPSTLMPTSGIPQIVWNPSLSVRADLRIHYRDQLVQAAGFDHPIFNEIIAEVMENASREKRWVADIEIQTAKIDFGGVKRVFLVVNQYPGWLIGDYLYVFRLTDPIPTLENPMPDVNGFMLGLGYGRVLSWNSQDHLFDDAATPTWSDFPPPFSDWNDNGMPDLVIWQGDLGNSCPPTIHLLELAIDGRITDISAPDVNVVPYGFVDNYQHGRWEMVGINRHSGASPDYYHWFAWNGVSYIDNSDQHIDFYQSAIDAFKQKLLSQPICYNPYDPTLNTILADYAAIHQLDQGWAEIELLLHWDTCTTDELRLFDDQIKAIKANVKAHRF